MVESNRKSDILLGKRGFRMTTVKERLRDYFIIRENEENV